MDNKIDLSKDPNILAYGGFDYDNASVDDIIPQEVPLKKDEIVTLWGVKHVDDIKETIVDDTLGAMYNRILTLISESTPNKYLTYNKERVIGVRRFEEVLVTKETFFQTNAYNNTKNIERLKNEYSKDKLEICVITNSNDAGADGRKWVSSPPTFINFSIVEVNEKPIYR